MSTPESEDEIYSTMFSSLKHPARRRILRMLSERPMSFSQMLEQLEISSSHLTYHLESLGELLSKMEDGKYKLSAFGEASVATMKGVEEAPATHPNRLSVLPFRWKMLLGLLLVCVVVLGSFSTLQYASLNQLSEQQRDLEASLSEANAEKQQLLSWGTGTDKAVAFIRNVLQIDITHYQASLLSNTVQYRADLGGVLEEVLKYTLTSSDSRLDIVLRYRNNHFSRFWLYLDEGIPVYSQPQPADKLAAVRGLLERYQTYSADSYLTDMRTLISDTTDASNSTTLGQTKLQITGVQSTGEVLLMYSEGGVDFSGKSLRFVFQNRVLTEFADGWFLLSIGSTQVNFSGQQAIEIAAEFLKNYTLNLDGTEVKDFGLVTSSATAEFIPHPREQFSLALYPYWYVTLPLDKVYSGQITAVTVGIWADTGAVANVQTLAG